MPYYFYLSVVLKEHFALLHLLKSGFLVLYTSLLFGDNKSYLLKISLVCWGNIKLTVTLMYCADPVALCLLVKRHLYYWTVIESFKEARQALS